VNSHNREILIALLFMAGVAVGVLVLIVLIVG
jgi:hypothetical protein